MVHLFPKAPRDLEYLEGHSFHSVPPGLLYLEDLMFPMGQQFPKVHLCRTDLEYLMVHLFRKVPLCR